MVNIIQTSVFKKSLWCVWTIDKCNELCENERNVRLHVSTCKHKKIHWTCKHSPNTNTHSQVWTTDLALRHPASRRHWATHRRQTSLSRERSWLPPKIGQFPSCLIIWCQANSFWVFPAFALCCLPSNIWPVLAICYHPSTRRVLSIRVFFFDGKT